MKKQDIINLKLHKTDKKNYYYFIIDEYILIFSFLKGYRLAIMTSVTNKQALSIYLDRLYIHNDDIKRTYLYNNDLGIVMNYRRMDKHEFTAILKDLIRVFKEENIHTVDRFTKEKGVLFPAFMDEEIEIVSRSTFALKKDQYVPKASKSIGILSSLLLLVIPFLIFAYGHSIGLFISLTGILFGLCSYLGYLVLGKRMDKKGLIISVISSMIMLLGSQYLSTAISIKDAMKDSAKNTVAVTTSQALSLVPSFYTDSEVLASMLPYLGLTLMFMTLTLVIMHIFYKRAHKLKGVYKLYD